MSRADLKEVGESLDAGESALVAIAAVDIADRVQAAIDHADKVERKELRADPAQVTADVAAAGRRQLTRAPSAGVAHPRRPPGPSRRASNLLRSPVCRCTAQWPARASLEQQAAGDCGAVSPGCRQARQARHARPAWSRRGEPQ